MDTLYKLIIFDVDGTLVRTKSGETFRQGADDWQWLPGRREKLHALKGQGIKLAVATNQGGVAFGYLQQIDILRELTAMCIEGFIPLGGLYVCYTHPKATVSVYRADDDRRKPGPRMLQEAMNDFEADQHETLMVGDREEDKLAAENAGVAFAWAHDFFK